MQSITALCNNRICEFTLQIIYLKILSISDLHYTLKHYEWLKSNIVEYDLLIIIGDLLDLMSPVAKEKQIADIKNYLNYYSSILPVLVSSGNHDLDMELDGELTTHWLSSIENDAIKVDGQYFYLENTLFSICPWWNGSHVRNAMVNMLKEHSKMDCENWVWLHHAPPMGSKISYTRKGNAGDPYVKKLVSRYKPDFLLCGHIHGAPYSQEGSWCDKIGDTWSFNAGKQTGEYPSNITIDLAQNTAEYTSYEVKESVHLI